MWLAGVRPPGSGELDTAKSPVFRNYMISKSLAQTLPLGQHGSCRQGSVRMSLPGVGINRVKQFMTVSYEVPHGSPKCLPKRAAHSQ